jgi:SpoVK/Ycf46/Vps4 family AAA+-type ATPase
MIETKSHRAALDTLLATGNLFFSCKRALPKIKLRLFPLLIGPTGAGKSFLVETAARQLQARYFRITRGDWIPSGSKGPRSTVFRILDEVASFDHVVLHVDELDKFTNLFEREWSASIASDLWNILDGKFQWTEYLRETLFPDQKKPSEQELARRVRSSLWIVGSGTWQHVFAENHARPAIGFHGGSLAETVVDFGAIARSEMISPELLHRFGEPIFVEYPTPEETQRLLLSTGISGLARQLGIPISADQIDWRKGGMRVLEVLGTRLTIALYRSKGPVQGTLPLEAEVDQKQDPSPY